VLSGIDLRACRFAGSHNLPTLRLEGRTLFSSPPKGWHTAWALPPLWRWEHRQTIAEEHHWRATTRKRAGWLANGSPQTPSPHVAAWHPPEQDQQGPPGPGDIARLYRELRKGLEDAKNEPGAADFYYGEMEMRRLDPQVGWAERFILGLYWLVSGYGLRGLRALITLAVVIVGVATLLHAVGYATRPTPPSYWGALLHAASSTLSISDDQVLLTGWGKLSRILLRLAGPVLLGLALLSIRNRVKR
jgi:hypothetical protein